MCGYQSFANVNIGRNTWKFRGRNMHVWTSKCYFKTFLVQAYIKYWLYEKLKYICKAHDFREFKAASWTISLFFFFGHPVD